ncbi:MAG: hypothetical protein ABL977_08245 [Candidatus Eisenbacteria bacterium]
MARPDRFLRALLLLSVAALWGMLAVGIQGCTLLGVAVGSSADNQNGTRATGAIFNVKPGAAIKLDMLDGKDITGRYVGWTRDSAAAAPEDSLSLRGVSVQVDVGFDRVSVPAERIARIHVPKSTGTLLGLVVGVGLDILVIRSLANSDPLKPTGCESSGGSPTLFGTSTVPAPAQSAPSTGESSEGHPTQNAGQ